MNDQYKICNNCRAKNDISALKCKSCQAPMTGSMVLNFQVSSEDKSFVVCKNCNTINKSTNLKCNSCNAPLVGSMVIDRNFHPVDQMNTNQPQNVNLESQKLQATASPNKTEQFGMKVCKRCEYPNLAIAKFCVKCNNNLDEGNGKSKTSDHGIRQEKSTSESNLKATVNPWISQKNEHNAHFDLIPIENNELIPNERKSFNGQSSELTRLNLDPENETITTSIQAQIYKKDNKWMISNKSKLKTTFIRIDSDQEIHDGMILMFGNKCFQFREEPK